MHNCEQAKELWCPMVRVARHEVTDRLDAGGNADGFEHHIVGGCNTDALGAGNGEPRRMHPDHRPLASCRCIADKCAMWRWGEPAPELRDANEWWPEEDDPATEPDRPAKVPASAVWIPLTGDGENIEGGFWREQLDVVKAENERTAASRRGYCGLAGRAEVTD